MSTTAILRLIADWSKALRTVSKPQPLIVVLFDPRGITLMDQLGSCTWGQTTHCKMNLEQKSSVGRRLSKGQKNPYKTMFV